MAIWPLSAIRKHQARQEELDARVNAAVGETVLSRHRLEKIRHEVIRPLTARGGQNQFAEMIYNSLLEGYEK